MVPHHWLAPSKNFTSQFTVTFTERCWFQELFEMEWKSYFVFLQNWSTLWNKSQFNSECLKILCLNLDKQHINLLLHTGILWIKRGRFLSRAFELKDVLQDYFQEDCRPEFAKYSEDEEWLQKLAYLQTFFIIWTRRTSLCKTPAIFFFIWRDKFVGFKRKFNLWKFMLWNTILKYFNCCWGLRVKKDTNNLRVLLKTILNRRIKLNIFSLPFNTRVRLGEEPLLQIICSA
jgi:hypothetical protein